MKLWRLKYGVDNGMDGTGSAWFGSKREAEKERARMRRDGENDDSARHPDDMNIVAENITTTKAGLIRYLNAHHSNADI